MYQYELAGTFFSWWHIPTQWWLSVCWHTPASCQLPAASQVTLNPKQAGNFRGLRDVEGAWPAGRLLPCKQRSPAHCHFHQPLGKLKHRQTPLLHQSIRICAGRHRTRDRDPSAIHDPARRTLGSNLAWCIPTYPKYKFVHQAPTVVRQPRLHSLSYRVSAGLPLRCWAFALCCVCWPRIAHCLPTVIHSLTHSMRTADGCARVIITCTTGTTAHTVSLAHSSCRMAC